MSSRPSLARELFEQIKLHPGQPDSVAYVRGMINAAAPTFETEYLEFKGGTAKDGGLLPDGQIKRIWSEVLAAFATTSGGVLIWGIDARKDSATGVDCASGLSLVPNVHVLQSRLNELHHQATDPPVGGVEYLSLTEEGGTQGFLVCLVPESEYKPHRSELNGKRWFMRIGDSFVDVPPTVLRSLFFPQRHSYIFFRIARTKSEVVPGGAFRATYQLRLFNEGPASAQQMLVVVQNAYPQMILAASDRICEKSLAVDGWSDPLSRDPSSRPISDSLRNSHHF